MNQQEAWNIVSQACSQLSANLQTHQAIQQALMILKPKVEADEPKMPGVQGS